MGIRYQMYAQLDKFAHHVPCNGLVASTASTMRICLGSCSTANGACVCWRRMGAWGVVGQTDGGFYPAAAVSAASSHLTPRNPPCAVNLGHATLHLKLGRQPEGGGCVVLASGLCSPVPVGALFKSCTAANPH